MFGQQYGWDMCCNARLVDKSMEICGMDSHQKKNKGEKYRNLWAKLGLAAKSQLRAHSRMAKFHDEPSDGILMKGWGSLWKKHGFCVHEFHEGGSSQKTRKILNYEGGHSNLVLRSQCPFWIWRKIMKAQNPSYEPVFLVFFWGGGGWSWSLKNLQGQCKFSSRAVPNTSQSGWHEFCCNWTHDQNF